MPKWFISSKNARHAIANGKKKKFKKANDSIMNRIFERFSRVGNINMNFAGVAPFNWEMMVSGPIDIINTEAVDEFCKMDNASFLPMIDSSAVSDFSERADSIAYDCIAEQIKETLTDKYGSIEAVYPSVVKTLFTGPALEKQSHKQMFWRVFGDIAVNTLEENLVACRICKKCGMNIPLWSKHECGKAPIKMFVCPVCERMVPRYSSRQILCHDCQKDYRKNYINEFKRNKRKQA